MVSDSLLHSKLEELKQELKIQGLWKKGAPGWVQEFRQEDWQKAEFFDWLQFVYLPNRLLYNPDFSINEHENFIKLQVKKHAGETLMDKKILSLLIEIDAI